MDRYPVLLAGNLAWQKLKDSEKCDIKVLGITSRGIYLLLSGWVIFLDSELSPGPLTLTIGEKINTSLLMDDHPTINSGVIQFPAGECEFVYQDAPVWTVPVRPGSHTSMAMRKKTLTQVISNILTTQPDQSYLLDGVNQLIHKDGISSNNRLYSTLESLKQGLIQKNFQAILQSAVHLLGQGNGLTPAGDDLITGMLLTLNRWSKNEAESENLKILNQGMIQNSYRSTTTLSANLIECAASGYADEKIIYGLDGIMTGKPGPAESADLFLNWGHHSGMDILSGIALTLVYYF